jgi:thiamine biosynthesis lipoprotein
MTDTSAVTDAHRFAHEAMATTFQAVIAGRDRAYAQQAAAAAFAEIDRIESALSRFVDSSDIARLNQSAPGQDVRIGGDAFDCLEISAQVCRDTNGAFDVTIGPLMSCWRNPDKSPRTPSETELAEARARVGMDKVQLDRATFSVRLKTAGMRIDLGGIGKGYALDCAAEILREWDISSALIDGGDSTVMAIGHAADGKGWPLGVGGSGPDKPSIGKVYLTDVALSGSGIEVQGHHIFDPRKGEPAIGKLATWSVCPKAAIADALSTAFMVLSPPEVEDYCAAHTDTCAMLLTDGGRYTRYGDWEGRLGLELRGMSDG